MSGIPTAETKAEAPTPLTEEEIEQVSGGLDLKGLVAGCPGCGSSLSLRIVKEYDPLILGGNANPVINAGSVGGLT